MIDTAEENILLSISQSERLSMLEARRLLELRRRYPTRPAIDLLNNNSECRDATRTCKARPARQMIDD
jgi:hypothetical protein